MKKYLILGLIPAFFACTQGGSKQTALADSLSGVNDNIKNELLVKEELLNNKEVAMNEFVASFNEIQGNLNEIKEKQKIISIKSEGVEFKKSNKDQIINDIQAIYDLLNKNKQKAASLAKKLENSNLKTDEIRLAVSNLTNQVNDKESEITLLKSNLEKLNVDFVNLKMRFNEEVEESNIKTDKLHTAYYVIGTNKDLAENGVITKEWTKITIPLQLFNFEDEKFDGSNVKQLIIQFEASGTIEVDAIEIVPYAGKLRNELVATKKKTNLIVV